MAYQPNLFGDLDTGADDSDGWCTPEWLLERVRLFWGSIDLDPCSNQLSTVGATTAYTLAGDGLSRPWFGRVWVNPPYSEPGPWMQRCVQHYQGSAAGEVLALPKGDWSTEWWRRYVVGAPARCEIDRRIDFVARRGRTVAPFPSALVYYGDDVHRFGEYFGALGEIVRVHL